MVGVLMSVGVMRRPQVAGVLIVVLHLSHNRVFNVVLHQEGSISAILVVVVFYGLWCLTPLSTIFFVISWRSVLLVEETGDNHQSTISH